MAINAGAWLIVKKYMPTHYIGATGPCCERCSLMLSAVSDGMSLLPIEDPDMVRTKKTLELLDGLTLQVDKRPFNTHAEITYTLRYSPEKKQR
jgi:hypothetical protein